MRAQDSKPEGTSRPSKVALHRATTQSAAFASRAGTSVTASASALAVNLERREPGGNGVPELCGPRREIDPAAGRGREARERLALVLPERQRLAAHRAGQCHREGAV